MSGDAEPGPDGSAELYTLLARRPIGAYLTANHDDFLAHALRREGKTPRAVAFPWRDGADRRGTEPAGWDIDHPVVFHLFGMLAYPESLVLTDADHLAFRLNLLGVGREEYADNASGLPVAFLDAIVNRPLFLLGFDVHDVVFRNLLYGVLRYAPQSNKRRHVAVISSGRVDHSVPDAVDRARRLYSHLFYGWNVSLFLGTVQDFCAELVPRMGGFAS